MPFIRTLVIAIAVTFPAIASAAPGLGQSACKADLKTLCGSVQPGGGRMRECMKEQRAELSAACKMAIADRVLERRKDKSASKTAPAPSGGNVNE